MKTKNWLLCWSCANGTHDQHTYDFISILDNARHCCTCECKNMMQAERIKVYGEPSRSS